jgi:beta-glucosidase
MSFFYKGNPMKLKISILVLLVSCILPQTWSTASASTDDAERTSRFAQAYEARIDSIIAVLTLDEKILMLHQNSKFSSAGIERLGIPELKCTDGPFGVREEVERQSWTPLGLTTDSATFFPTGSALAATWNPELAFAYGQALGQEAWARGKDIILGPAINITRTPVNGRTFEYMSEDPYLNSRLAVGYIDGVQSTGVAACVKHFAVNNQETNRATLNVLIDERTLREIYLPAFRAAIQEAGAKCLMSAYNKVRGQYCGEDEFLLNQVAKGEWGFKGLVMSDWGGTHSTVAAALNGLDVEMGTDEYFSGALATAVTTGKVPVSVIDEKVRRILRVIFYCRETPPAPAHSVVVTAAHTKTAYDVASESIVLLKNSSKLLPLAADHVKKIAVIGDNATHKHSSGGFGAGVKAQHEVTPLAGLQHKLGNSVSIRFARGYEPAFKKKDKGRGRIPDSTPNEKLIAEAVEAARNADVAIVVAGTNHDVETEATDRPNLTLPFGQDELIRAVAAVNPKTIVVVAAGAPVDLRSINASVSAVLFSWYNGSEGGTALADVLFGDVNPSGKLPLTFPATLDDSPAHALHTFPGDSTANYAEGILVGYRWFDTKHITPTYCFGYGLSYTDFAYSAMTTDKQAYTQNEKIQISLKLKNTGPRPGDEVVQLYVRDMAPVVPKAEKELKAFRKIMVPAGSEVDVHMQVNASDIAYYDALQMKWVVAPGAYKLQAGSSSQDIRATSVVTIK